MNTTLEKIVTTLVPFLVFGVAIAFFISMIVLLSYVLLWGLLIGSVLYFIVFIKNKLFPIQVNKTSVKHKQGRTIEHDHID